MTVATRRHIIRMTSGSASASAYYLAHVTMCQFLAHSVGVTVLTQFIVGLQLNLYTPLTQTQIHSTLLYRPLRRIL